MLDRIEWHDDHIHIGDTVFYLQTEREDKRAFGEDHFALYKSESLVRIYIEAFTRLNATPKRIFEIGIWDGGSTAFWNEFFHPEKLVAIDQASRGDSAYFQRYLEHAVAQGRVKTYWGTDQGDTNLLREIVHQEFDGSLDLVIDDGSHMYDLTKRSFEALFPFLAPGGLYIVEDWNWGYSSTYQAPDHPWSGIKSLAPFVGELLEATGTTDRGLIRSLTTYGNFAIAERGWAHIPEPKRFSLDDYIARPLH